MYFKISLHSGLAIRNRVLALVKNIYYAGQEGTQLRAGILKLNFNYTAF